MSTQSQAALRAAYELDRERKATKRRNLAAFRQMLQERYGGKPTRSEGPICVVRLTARPTDRPTAHQCLPPICDHPNVWLVNGRPSAFTSEPRLALDSPRIEEARAFAGANGLDFEVSDGSWWEPPDTCLVVYLARRQPGEMWMGR